MMSITMKPRGFAYPESEGKIPQHWTVSDCEGRLVIQEEYLKGLKDLKAGQRIVVIFHFDRSPEFTPEFLIQTPHYRDQPKRVFKQ
jgi:tRNA (Thr-GGU) A37 N-methylase